MAQIQFSFRKKKIGRPEHLLPPPPTSDNISFLPYPPPPSFPPQSGRHMRVTPYHLRYFRIIHEVYVLQPV